MRVVCAMFVIVVGCGTPSSSVEPDASVVSTTVSHESLEAQARVRNLRATFRAIPPPVVTRFERIGAVVRAVLPPEARSVPRTATVSLPPSASGAATIEDDRSHVSVRFALRDTQSSPLRGADGMALYRAALHGADVLHRVHGEGTEDYVAFETRPAAEELRYDVDVSRVAGMRLVSNTLEFLGDDGTPLLRVAPPVVLDAHDNHYPAALAVEGCAYDSNPAGPWRRAVTKPGADHCTLRVTWSNVTYPLVVDPSWIATGSMITTRAIHSAAVLLTGQVLVAGGNTAAAELYDPSGNGGVGTFAATGAMPGVRQYHRASLLTSGKVLITGGTDGNTPLSSALLYDPVAGTFSATGSMSVPRLHNAASVLPSGKVLVTGGCGGASCNNYYTAAEIFDPGAGAFVATGSMTSVRTDHTSTLLTNGNVLIAGGHSNVSPYTLTSAEIFDPTANNGVGAFTATGSMTAGRYFHAASALPSGKVLVTGGNDVSAVGTAELFDPTGNAGVGTFAATGLMVQGHYFHSSTTLPSGLILVVGGSGSNTNELFDPAGNGGVGTFSATAPLATWRYQHSASLLPSGEVVVAGGTSVPYNYMLASAERMRGQLGDTCSDDKFCVSTHCVDGRCCDTQCTANCDRCDVSGKEGTCSVAPAHTPANPTCVQYLCDGTSTSCPTSCSADDDCTANYYCAPDSTCHLRKAQGLTCDAQADCKVGNCRECATSFCVDGFCCDQACDGTCVACAASLKYAASGDGTCGAAKAGPDPGGTTCAAPQATCDGDHTTTGTDLKQFDCTPYKCTPDGKCRADCLSVDDCVAPTICDANGKCNAPTPTSSDGGGGCAFSGRSSSGTLDPVFVLGLGVLVLRRRKKRST